MHYLSLLIATTASFQLAVFSFNKGFNNVCNCIDGFNQRDSRGV